MSKKSENCSGYCQLCDEPVHTGEERCEQCKIYVMGFGLKLTKEDCDRKKFLKNITLTEKELNKIPETY